MLTAMSKPRPIVLDYASRRDDQTPFDWVRALWLAVAISVPPIACYAWAWFGIEWFVPRPLWGSGQPIDAISIYQRLFIERPLVNCTLLLGLEAAFIVVMVVRRRWPVYWLVALSLVFVAWMVFYVMLLSLAEKVFP